MNVNRIVTIGLVVCSLAVAASFAIAAEPTAPPLVKEVKASDLYTSSIAADKPYSDKVPPKWEDIEPLWAASTERSKPATWKMSTTGAKHPVILFDPDDLPMIRRRLKKGAGPRILESLKKQAEQGKPAEAGLYATITNDKSLTPKAIDNLIRRAKHEPGDSWLSNGGQIYYVALGYDLLYNYMTPEQRELVRTRLDKLAHNAHLRRAGHTEGNWLPHIYGALGMAGFALQQENAYADGWILHSRYANLLYLHNTFDPDGAGCEALSRYFAMGMDKVLICFAADRRQGNDFFPYRNNLINQNIEFMAYMLRPDRRAWVPFDDAFIEDVDNPQSFGAVAGLTGDRLAQGLFERQCPSPRTWFGNVALLAAWYNPSVPSELPENSRRLPLARAYWGHRTKHLGLWSSGHVFMRTGFDRRDDILFASQCGDTSGWHGHADQASIYLYAYGDVLVQDPAITGSYHEPLNEWQKGPEAHSQVLIDGQATPDYTVGNKLNWPKRFHHAGEIDGFAHTRTLDFVSMDFVEGLALNPKVGKAKRAKRYVIFFRHPKRTGYFVIIDDVIMDDAPHRYEWLLQPDDKHKAVKEGPGRFAFTGRVDLKIRMVEPSDPAHEMATFEGYGVDYLRLRSSEDRKRGLFVTVLQPKRKGMTLPTVEPIRNIGMVGAKIGEDIVLFRKAPAGTMRSADVETNGELVALRITRGKVSDAVVWGGDVLKFDGKKVEFARPAQQQLEE